MVQARITAVFNAISIGELSFTLNNRVTTFHSLDSAQRHLDWLMALETKLTNTALAAAGDPSMTAPVVTFREPDLAHGGSRMGEYW
jgi:hypothetical protein